jgi:hypothetical protein
VSAAMPFPFDGVFGSDFFTFAVLGMGKVESRFRVGRRGLRARKSDCSSKASQSADRRRESAILGEG